MANPAISGLAGMMAGAPMMGGEMENEAEDMVPCPMCMGTGMVSEDVAEAMNGAMPSGLAMRRPPQLSPMAGAPMAGGSMPAMNMGA